MKVVGTTEDCIARSVSVFGWSRIYVGRRYLDLPAQAQRAAIAHEVAHIAGHHTEWRALALLVFWWFPPLLRAICHWQEYRADEFAAWCGERAGLLYLLQRDSAESLTHPKNMDRRKKLLHI